jgi:hypothetical protein
MLCYFEHLFLAGYIASYGANFDLGFATRTFFSASSSYDNVRLVRMMLLAPAWAGAVA